MPKKPGIKIRILPATAVFIAAFLTANFSPKLFIIALAAALHEFGHIAAALICGIRLSEITVYPFGADIKIAPGEIVPYIADILLRSAGIIANLIGAAGAFLWLHFTGNDVFALLYGILSGINPQISTVTSPLGFFLLCCLVLATVNALPIGTLDGGAILSSLLLMKTTPETAAKATSLVSFAFIFALWLAACYFIMFYGANFNLLIICAYLFVQLFLTKKASSEYSGTA